MNKKTITRSKENFKEIEEHRKQLTYDSYMKNAKIRFNSVLEDDIIIVEDIGEIKKFLKLAVLARGFKNIDDYANNSNTGYSAGSIKIAFSPSHATSDKIIFEIAKDLEVNLQIEEKKIYKIIQD